MRQNRNLPLMVVVLALSLPAVRAGVEWGGILEPGREQNLRLSVGAVIEFEGMVTETTRKLYDVTGHTWKQDGAESYDASDFNLDGPYGTIGLSFDSAWKFIRLQVDTLFLNPSTEAHARRDYYMRVGDEIEYEGNSYNHLMIPEGTPFSAELFGNMTELNFLLVPVGFTAGDRLRINPSLDFGVLLFGGIFEIDAGKTRGIKTYQNPPEDFAIGGSSGGYAILGTPQWGPGVDIRLGKTGGPQFDMQAHYLFVNFNGSTAWITTAGEMEKNLELDHQNLRVRGQLEIPLKRTTLTLGVQIQMIKTEGSATAVADTPEEVLRLQERFDKDFSFKMNTVMATIGLTF